MAASSKPRETDDPFGDPFGLAKTKGKPSQPKKIIVPSSDRVVAQRQVVSLVDKERKLTKKHEKDLAGWKGANRGSMMDVFIGSHVAATRKKFGHESVFVGSEAESLVIGIPTPSLAFEFLIMQDVFPLGLIFQLVSPTGLGKSALLAEFGRWFNEAGGGFEVEENETKYNPLWYQSILGDELYERTPINRCDSIEGWQEHLTFSITNVKRYMTGTKESPGPGPVFPMLFGVDSIMGKLSRDSQEKILGAKGKQGMRGTTGEGSASRGWPEEALLITRYLKAIPGEMDNWPISIVLINHLKMRKDDQGNPFRGKSGGEQVSFQESFEIEIAKVGGPKKVISCSEWKGYPVSLTCFKNSFGGGLNYIQTRLLWWFEPDPRHPGRERQHTSWDWDWSTIWLLNNIREGNHADPFLRRRLKDADFHLDCPSSADIENKAWSKSLGMTAKDATTWSEVGAMIRDDAELMERLRGALGINRRPLLNGHYLKQLNALSEKLS